MKTRTNVRVVQRAGWRDKGSRLMFFRTCLSLILAVSGVVGFAADIKLRPQEQPHLKVCTSLGTQKFNAPRIDVAVIPALYDVGSFPLPKILAGINSPFGPKSSEVPQVISLGRAWQIDILGPDGDSAQSVFASMDIPTGIAAIRIQNGIVNPKDPFSFVRDSARRADQVRGPPGADLGCGRRVNVRGLDDDSVQSFVASMLTPTATAAIMPYNDIVNPKNAFSTQFNNLGRVGQGLAPFEADKRSGRLGLPPPDALTVIVQGPLEKLNIINGSGTQFFWYNNLK